MPRTQRVAFIVLAVAAAVGGIVDASIYAVATTSLAAGTSVAGFDSLSLANHLAAVVAGLAALAVIVRTFGSMRLAVPAFSLLMISGLTALIAGGLYALGLALFKVSNLTILNSAGGRVHGSPELELNSLLSGVMGSGYDLAPVPVVLAVAAVLVPLIAVARSAYARRTVALPAQATA